MGELGGARPPRRVAVAAGARTLQCSVTVTNVGTFVLQYQSAGDGTASDVRATGVGYYGQYNCGAGFRMADGGGNSGWNTTHCGFPPLDAGV